MKTYYKTVIFDFDGTIADSLSTVVQVYKTLAKKYNLKKLPAEEINILRTKRPLEIISYLHIPFYKIPSILFEGRALFTKNADNLQPFNGIPELLKTLKKQYKLGILTSNNRDTVMRFLKKQKLEVFDFIHSEKNLFGKDVALEHILENYNLEKDKTIYVGDEVRDIVSCNKIELPIIAVTWGFNEKGILSKNNPTYLADYPEELTKIL